MGSNFCGSFFFFFLLLLKIYFIEVELIYNVLISAVQQNDSVIHIYIYSFSYSNFEILNDDTLDDGDSSGDMDR